MAEKVTGAVKAVERHSIEHMHREAGIPDAVHTGACTQMGWKQGKEVTKKEYLAAVERFNGNAAERKGHA